MNNVWSKVANIKVSGVPVSCFKFLVTGVTVSSFKFIVTGVKVSGIKMSDVNGSKV